MKIPDICPIQIWPVSKPTFNQMVIRGIQKQYFTQVYNANGILRVPINFEVTGSYLLELFDVAGILVDIFEFIVVSEGNYRATIDFSQYPDLADTKVIIKISKGNDITHFASETLDPLWTIEDGDPTLNHTTVVTDGADLEATVYVALPTPILTGQSITFKVRFHCEGGLFGTYMNVFLGSQPTPGSSVISNVYNQTFSDNGDFEFLVTLTATNDDGSLETDLVLNFGKLGGTPGVDICSIEFIPFTYQYSEDNYLGQSDCFTLLSDISNCVVVGFTNSKNFDNVDFETDQPIYYLLLDGTHFWEETMTSTEEDHELSSGVIVPLRTETYVKRLLRLYDPVPDYIHRKLRKILQLDTIHIDDLFWRLNGAEYVKTDIETSTITPATVLLTQYDSGLVNIGGGLGGGDFNPDDFDDDDFA